MNQRIIYSRPDGGVSIVIPTGEIDIDAVIAKDVPAGVEHEIVDVESIPADRDYRNAWEISEGKIGVNMPKAFEIQKDRLRMERKPLLEALDVEYMQALEKGDTAAQAAIAAQKQSLRDATDHPLIAEATTPEELKAVTLDAIVNAQKA